MARDFIFSFTSSASILEKNRPLWIDSRLGALS
jgi:hypothetical protein